MSKEPINGESREISNIPMGMRPGLRQLNDASLRVNMTIVVPEHMRPAVREITDVLVPVASRGKRLATALLNFVCQEADASGITLILTARAAVGAGDNTALDGPDDKKLIAWYKKFGFVELESTPTGMLMARQVHEKSRIEEVRSGEVRDAVRSALQSKMVH